MVPLYGFGGVPYSAVRKAAPRNILDNSDFTNLVAQAGIGGNHGTIAYAADRWILDSGTVSYAAGVGLTLNGTIRQKLEFPPTGETSAFVGMASGTASISYADGAVTITSSGGVIKWAALYGGVYSAATMPEYQPKGYGAELAECQRYYVNSRASYPCVYGCAFSATEARACFPVPATMRVTPSVAVEAMSNISIFTASGAKTCSAVSVYGMDSHAVYLTMKSTGLTVSTPITVRFNSLVELSADL
jgi:hypothetical protein